MIETKDFLRAVAETSTLLGGTDYELAIAEAPDQRFYTIDGGLMSQRLCEGLEHRFPGLDSDEIDMVCRPIIAYLEGPTIMLKYIVDKAKRDYILQKILESTPEGQELLRSSITKSGSIRNMFFSMESFLPGEFQTFINSLKKLYSNLLKSSDDCQRIQTAKNAREITYKFGIDVIVGVPLE